MKLSAKLHAEIAHVEADADKEWFEASAREAAALEERVAALEKNEAFDARYRETLEESAEEWLARAQYAEAEVRRLKGLGVTMISDLQVLDVESARLRVAESDKLIAMKQKIRAVCARPVRNYWSKQAHDNELAARVDEIEGILEDGCDE